MSRLTLRVFEVLYEGMWEIEEDRENRGEVLLRGDRGRDRG